MTTIRKPRPGIKVSVGLLRRRLFRIGLCIAVSVAALGKPMSVQAQTYTWNQNPAGPAQTGTWNIANANWLNDSNATSAWNNGTFLNALFAGNNTASSTVALGDAMTAGGLQFNTGGYTIVTTALNTLTLDTAAAAAPIVAANSNATIGAAGINGILGTKGLNKTGGGTLTLLGNNTGLSGPVTINGGTLAISGNVNAAGTAQPIQLNFGTLRLLHNAAGSNSVAATAFGNAVTINGNSTINVDNAGANTNNTNSIASLALNNSSLTVTNGNSYGLQVVGATTLGGAISTISTGLTFTAGNANPTSGMLALSGGVTGAGALNKLGTGNATLFGANNYSGGTNIFAGAVTLANSTAVAGTGSIVVYQGAALAITNAANATLLGGQTLALAGQVNSMAILRVDSTVSDVVSGSSLGSMFVSPYGGTFQINTGAGNFSAAGVPGAATTYTQNIDLAAVGSAAAGNGPIFLGVSTSSTMSGTVANSGGGDIRLGGSGTLTLTAANVFGATAQTVQVGSPIGNIQTVTAGSGTFALQGTNTNYTGTMTVNKLATLSANATSGTNPWGTGPLVVLGGTATTSNANFTGGPQFGNSAIQLYPSAGVSTGAGSQFTLDNSAVTLAGGTTNLRMAATMPVNAWGGSTFSFIGSNTAATTTNQAAGTFNFQGGDIINLTVSSTAANNADAVLTIANLVRNGSGTLAFTRAGTTQPAAFGLNAAGTSDSRVILTNINGAAPVVTNGMIAPWLVDQTSNTFLTHAANGIEPVAYNVTATTAASLQGAAATAIVDVNTAFATTGNASVHALRIGGAISMTGTNTITIGSGSLAAEGAGLILNSTTATQTHTPNFTFGTGGNREAVIFATGGQITVLSGAIAANGLTKFGPNQLTISGANTTLAGTITVNQGVLVGTATGFNFLPIAVNGSQADFNGTINGIYLNDVTATGEGLLSAGNNAPRVGGLAIAARPGPATTPTTLQVNSPIIFGGGLTLTNGLNYVNGNQASGGNGGNQQFVLGAVTGGGALNKWGNGFLTFTNAANTYGGGTVINGVGGNDNRATVRSFVGTAGATPFGSGGITVQPGGVLGLAAPDNAGTNAVTLNSDMNGLATVNLLFGGSAPLPTFGTTTLNNGNLGGPFAGVIGIEAVGFATNVNLNTLWGGTAFLGSGSNQAGTPGSANYTGTLTPSTVGPRVADLNGGAPVTGNSVYRIGAGGGTLQFVGPANQFTGTVDIQVGAVSNVTAGASVGLANGNGTASIYNANNISGNVYLNTGGVLAVGRNNALGTARIVFNGGTIQSDSGTGLPFFTPTRTITNPIGFTGDAVFGGSVDLILTAPLPLADNQNGVTRTFNVINTTGITTISGIISDGAGSAAGNSITKTGGGPLVLSGVNTYTGFTNINAGTLLVTGDSSVPAASRITLGGGSLGAWTNSFTTNRDYVLTATNGGFDVGPGLTLTQGAGGNISGAFQLAKNGLGTLVLNGSNSFNSGNAIQLNNGVVQVGANVNLGDPAVNGQIVANSGALRTTASFSTNRVFLPNTNATTSITLDVVPGTTLAATNILNNNGTGVFSVIKTGAGTFLLNSAALNSTETALIVQGGTFQVGNTTGTPFGASAALSFNGGTYQQTNPTANQAFATTATASFGGGGYIGMQSAAAFSSQFQAANINRSGAGTLIVSPGTSALGVAGNANNARVIPTTLINGVAVASANVNGILAPNILSEIGGFGGFLSYGSATTGLVPYAGATVGTLTGLQPTSIFSGAGGAVTGTGNSIYALATTGNLTGTGTLRVPSLTGSNQGGLLLNGSINVSPNLIFDPTAASGGSASSGEGLVYVAPSFTSTISGTVSANSFVKFGSGNLTLSGNTAILNALTVQEGTLTLGGGLTFDKMQTDLVLNNAAVLNLAGNRVTFATLGNTTGVTGGIAGGTISSSTNNGALVINGNNATATTFSGNILDGAGTTSLVKSGTGSLTLGNFSVNNPEAGNNTFSGGTILNQGILTVNDPRALGTGTLTANNGTLNLRSNGPGINSTIIVGAPGSAGINVMANGLATISSDRIGANSGNVFQFNNLALNEGQLNFTGGNSYHTRFNGTTTIAGGFGTINNTGNDFTNAAELAGPVVGSGILNKLGSNYFKGLIVSGTANTYSGGTTIQSGYLQVTGTAGTPLGTGQVTVYPGAALRIGANIGAAGTIGGAPLRTLSRWNSFGIVGIDNDNFNPATTLAAASFSNSYGTILAITRPFFAGSLDQSTIGDGRSILAGGLNIETGYLGTLSPGLGDGVATRTYRLAGGNNLNAAATLAIIGADNILNDSAAAGTSLSIGSRASIVASGAIQNSGNTVVIRNSNNFTGGTWIGKGITVQLETGGSPAGSTPLGSANGTLSGAATNVELYGTLTNSGFGSSFVNAATGKNSVTTTLRPGGGITVNDIAGVPAGGQGRWADTAAGGGGVALNGGFFQYSGAAGLPSVETIGTLTITGGGRVLVNRQNDANTTTLITQGIARTAPAAGVGGGTLTLEPRQAGGATAGILGIPNLATTQLQQSAGFVRFLTSGTAPALAGTTINGAGVTNPGMAAPWIIDSQANSFVTYNPTAANTGFQPLISAAPNPGQVSYNKIVTTALTAGQIVAGDIVDLTTATNTLIDASTTVYALRTSVQLNPTLTANTLTLTSGGLIINGGLTINNSAGIASSGRLEFRPFTLNFGAGGAGEAFIYATNNDSIINAQIVASALTRFGPQGSGNALTLTGNNLLTGPVTINAGRIVSQNTLTNTGTAVGGVFNGRDVILAGAGTQANSRLSLAGAVGNSFGSVQASGSNATTLLGGTIYVNGDSRLDTNTSTVSQRVTNLVFADLGIRSPVALQLGGGVYVQGTTSLGANDNILNAFFDTFAQSTLAGTVSGGTLTKYGNGSLMFGGAANTFAGLVVNGSDLNTASSIVGSLTATGNPFGAGAITVNPGGLLRMMNGSNIASNSSIAVKTDEAGLGGIGFSTNLGQAQINGLFGTGAGKVNMTSTTNYAGVVAIDANSFNSALDIGAIETAIGGGKKILLGTSVNPLQTYFNNGSVVYFAPTLGSSADNIYRFGGGGNQGGIAFGVGTFENIFGAGKSIEVGAATAANGAAANALVNGNSGTFSLDTRNTAFNGTVTLNPNAQLSVENAYALGTGTIVFNQNNATGAGGIRIFNSQTVANAISVTGDVINVFSGGDSATFTGNVNLSPNGVGGVKNFGGNYGNVANSTNIAFSGVVSGAGVSVIKTGGNNNNAGTYIFRGTNTFSGTTTVNAGFLIAGTDVLPNVAGAFGNSDTPILLGNAGGNSAGSIAIGGQFTFGRSIVATSISGNAVATIRGQGVNTSVITGGITTLINTTGGGLGIDNTGNGVLDLQGPITGTGSVQFGAGATGIVRLSASANGLGTSTYSGTGGTNIFNGRIQIGSDTYFTGNAATPTIISGPIGTGPLFLGRQGSGTGGIANQSPTTAQIDAFGGDRTIVNVLGTINSAGNTTITFGGRNNLTFANTTSVDISSDGTLRNRTFTVTTPGTVTIAAGMTAGGGQGVNFLKQGAGTLVVTGTNTFANILTTDGNYGRGFFIDAGVLSVSADANLGNATSLAAGGTHLAGPADVVLRGGALRSTGSFTTARQFILTTASGIEVTAGNTLTLSTQTFGAFGLTKIGNGILSLNNGANAFTNLVIGGNPGTGGTVGTTATSGTPFGTAASTITINGGRLSLDNTANVSAQSIATTSIEVRGGAYLQLAKGAAQGSVLAASSATLGLSRGSVVAQGTLTLLPSTIANLGAAAANSENFTAANYSGASNTNGMLTSPFVNVRLTGSGQDANFVQYGANGFSLHATTTIGTIDGGLATDATKLGDISVPGVTAATGVNNLYALRTAGNIAPNDPTTLIGIANGGLIINGSTAPILSANLAFGTIAAGPVVTPAEAIIYVRDGQTGGLILTDHSTISGSIVATNLTKAGPGNLLLSGAGSTMAPTSSALRVIQINEGLLAFTGQSSLPSGGLVYINPMDSGTLNLNGQSLGIAGLGNGTANAALGTGTVANAGATATLTLNANTTNTQFNGLISGNIALVKNGTATQILGNNNFAGTGGNTYSGGTTINVGLITSATGLFTPVGTLQANGISGLGSGPITLAGGQLTFGSTLAAAEIDHNIGINTQGPNNGYDVTIAANNNFGSANATSTLSTNGAVAWQAINSVNVLGPNLNFGGGGATNILVKGQTTFAGNSIINAVGGGVLAGRISAAGFSLTKIGGQTLFLSNTEAGGNANAVGSWTLYQGTTEARMSDGGTNSLGTNAITLNGATLNLRHDGDNLSDPQTLASYGSTVLSVGSTAAVSGTSYITSANSTLSVDRQNGASNKTIQIQQIAFGGPLGASLLTYVAGNNYTVEVVNGVTMVNNAPFALNNTVMTISGQLSGAGTFFRQGGGELALNTVATNTGGTMLFQGTTNFGSFAGNTRTLSNTAMFAPGDITVNVATTLRFNTSGNVNGGQRVDARANLAFYPVIGIGSNEAISAFNLRVPLAGGPVGTSLVTSTSTGGGVLAINSPNYSQAIDLSRIGDGTWHLGSNNNAAGVTTQSSASGVYTGSAAITASTAPYNFGVGNAFNANGVYRLGGGGQFLNIGLPGGTANTLTDGTGFTTQTSLVVGGPSTGVAANGSATPTAIGGTTGTVVLNTAQNYTGTTLVNTGSTLEFRGSMATTGYEVFGTLAAGGAGGSFAGGPNPVMRPGSLIRLDNTFDLTSAVGGRWGDATQVNLDSSTLRLIGNSALDIRETVGTIAFNGNAFLTGQSAIAGRSVELNIAGLSRGTGAMLSIEPTNGAQLGTNERITTAGANLAAQIGNIPGGMVNGMVAPAFYNNRDTQFLAYSDFGFVNAGFNTLYANSGTQTVNFGALTDRSLVNGSTIALNAGVQMSAYALRVDSSIALGTAADNTAAVTISSGGLITGQNVSLTPKLVFGSIGTPTEAFIAVTGNTLTIGDSANPTTSGQITASAISKSGDGALTIQSNQTGFSGAIYLNRGTLNLFEPGTGTVAFTSSVGGVGGTVFMNGPTTVIQLKSDQGTGGQATTFQNSVSLRAGVLMGRIDTNQFTTTGGTTARDLVINNLTFGGAAGDQGQTLTSSGANNFSLRVAGTTDLGPAGFAYFNLVSGGVNVTLGGPITGSAALVAEGNNGTLFLGQNAIPPTAGWTTGGGLIVTTRAVQANALPVTAGADSAIDATKTYLGTGPITLAGGTLNLRVDGDNNGTARLYSFPAGNAITMTGSATLGADRITASGGSNKTLVFPALNIGGQTLTIANGNTFRLGFSAVNMTGFPNISVGSGFDSYVQAVSDGGADLGVIKNGAGILYFNGTANAFSGGVYANAGAAIRFGTQIAASSSATAGTGTLRVNPGGAIQLQAATNLNPSQLIDVRSGGGVGNLGILQLNSTINPATLVTSGSSGLLLATGTFATALNMGAIGDGTFQLATTGAITYSATTLGVGAGNTYRLGGNGQNLTLTAANNNVLTGAGAVVRIGSLSSTGGTFTFNNTNNYSGGTVIARGAAAAWSTSNNAGGSNTPLGPGSLDVFGTASALATATGGAGNVGLFTQNAVTIHPASTVLISNAAATAAGGNVANRWGGGAIALNGSAFSYSGPAFAGTSNETFTDFSFAAGSRVISTTATANSHTTLTVFGNFTRTGSASLVFVPSAGDLLGAPSATSLSQQFIVSTVGQQPALANGIAPAYFVDGASNQFVTYGANGFIDAAYTAAALNLPSGRTSGTDIAQVTGNVSLTDNPVLYALGVTAAATVSNGAGQLNSITLSGSNATSTTFGGIIAANAAITINPHIKTGTTGQFELPIFVNGSTTTLNGDISATGITKFGGGTLAIGKDQTDLARGPSNGYASGWTVNEGALQPNTFGALGNAVVGNPVNLNGSTAAGANNVVAGASVLRLAIDAGNPSLNFFSMGDLNVLDVGTVSVAAQADRTIGLGSASRISNINVTSTGGNLLDAQFVATLANSRNNLIAGDLSLLGTNAGVQVNVQAAAQVSGNSSGLSIARLVGGADTRLVKWGTGVLYVRGDSTTFAGSVSIEQGAVQINTTGGLGDASGTNTITVKRNGVLDLNTAGFARTDVTFQAGSILRLSADNAIASAINIGGASLQVGFNQSNSAAITMNGGSIQGYLRLDDNLGGGQGQAVYRTLGANVGIVLAGNSFLGQDILQGANGLDNGRGPTVFAPITNTLIGSSLEIKGVISGAGGLTKQGYDTVTLSGANTYVGTTMVQMGQLRIGAANALPASGTLRTTGGGVFDINGYNQTVGQLSSPADGLTPATTNAAGSGYITNTATTINTLTVGNATTAGQTYTYGGVIQYNVALAKTGAGTLQLTNANTYVGGTSVNNGVLLANNTTGSATGRGLVTVNNGGTLGGGNNTATRGVIGGSVTVNSGGVLAPGSGVGTLTIGSVSSNATVTMNAGSNYGFEWSGTQATAAISTGASSTPGSGHDTLAVNGTFNVTPATQNFIAGNFGIVFGAGDFNDFAADTPYSFRIGTQTANYTTSTSYTPTVDTSLLTNFTNFSTITITTVAGQPNVYLNFQPVPETTHFLLIGSALGTLIHIRRRRAVAA